MNRKSLPHCQDEPIPCSSQTLDPFLRNLLLEHARSAMMSYQPNHTQPPAYTKQKVPLVPRNCITLHLSHFISILKPPWNKTIDLKCPSCLPPTKSPKNKPNNNKSNMHLKTHTTLKRKNIMLVQMLLYDTNFPSLTKM
jgi:hypothetical protein